MGLHILLLCAWLRIADASVLEVVSHWSLFEFDFQHNIALQERYQPENTVPTGLEIGWDKIYLGIPRLRAGVPATLAWIPRNLALGSSPVLQPYPDWSFHSAGSGHINCSGLISVYRMRADRCNRLWVLDAGVVTSLDDFRRVCPPKILVFDMATDEVVRSVFFPRELLRPSSLLTNMVLDDTRSHPSFRHGPDCDRMFVYISDTVAPGIIVYDAGRDNAWRMTHASMYPDPDMGEYVIDGDRFTLMDGVVGLAFSPVQGLLYYQPLATDRLFSVSTDILTAGPLPEGAELPVNLVGAKASQGLGIAVDPRDDTIIFSTMTQTAIASWNPITFVHKTLAKDTKKLQFCAEVRWVERDDGTVWALSSRFHKFFKRTVSRHEINIRVVRINQGLVGHLLRRSATYNSTLV